jgi:4-hydroxythreonine-4-phosphate dehydrogenase
MSNFLRILFTCGDVNGIGPEISLKLFSLLLNKKTIHHLIFICPNNVFNYYSELLSLKLNYKVIKNLEDSEANVLNLIGMKNCKIQLGKPTSISGSVAFDSLMISIDLLKQKKSSVVITAPVSKYAINLAGIKFIGQTELFANEFKVRNYLMMFISSKIKAFLHTIHIPLKEVSNFIRFKPLSANIELIVRTLQNDFNINNPSIAVLGLNPHSGENGKIGNEEKIIKKAIYNYDNVFGPFASDAFFGKHHYKNYDVIFGMYHDQVLIPFKMLNFDKGVNYTAGLPIVRTSPDHGTAFDIAGKNKASFTSLFYAFKYATQISRSRLKNER